MRTITKNREQIICEAICRENAKLARRKRLLEEDEANEQIYVPSYRGTHNEDYATERRQGMIRDMSKLSKRKDWEMLVVGLVLVGGILLAIAVK